MGLTLKRTKQCDHCPWRKDVCVDEIPGYVPELHPQLENTIAKPTDWTNVAQASLSSVADYGTVMRHLSEKKRPVSVGWSIRSAPDIIVDASIGGTLLYQY